MIELPDEDGGERESRERFELIQRFAKAMANPECDADCEGTGIDVEGSEWTLCECVQSKLERSEAGEGSLAVARHPHQDVEPRRLTLTRREIGALLAAGNLSYQGVTLLVEKGPGSIDLTDRSEAEVERLRAILDKIDIECAKPGADLAKVGELLDNALHSDAAPDRGGER